MKYSIKADRYLTQNGWQENCVIQIDNGKIVNITNGDLADFHAPIVTTGLIDPHIHGGNGFDVMNATVGGMEEWLLNLAKSGVSAILATPYSATMESMRSSLEVISEVMRRQKEVKTPGARLLGAHLEGPFISDERLGEMVSDYVIEPTTTELKKLIDGYEDIISEMSLAPEIEGANELINYLKLHNIKLQIGHSNATFEEAEKAFKMGVGSVCHIFNASRPIHHRSPGFITSAFLNKDVYCEMITDLVHLHPAIVKLICQNKGTDKVIVISDAVSTTNMPDGEYLDNGVRVVVENGCSFVKDGGLNGGKDYVSGALRNLISLGFPIEEAVRMASYNTAKWLNSDICSQNIGSEVFLTCWNEKMYPLMTAIGDNRIEGENL